ncbi:polyprenyl synthetase family protein [Ferrovum sp.]|uniref:polyprenyl synthetase family protein n=1 Tax=Ferrovum sp. TaxID=2609467 RepID=UPI002604B56A|nr:farnesyl diphosphate synthase [Ferrovum sp.]
MTVSPDFSDWMTEQRAAMEQFLDQQLPAPNVAPTRLHEAMRHAALGGGKRIRALLALAAGELVGAPRARLLCVAGSLELIHTYSLIHDDLPCLDNDVLRRGKPTCHIQFGEATALLAGDALQSLAFQWLSEESEPRFQASQISLIHLLAVASGSRGMAGGQAIDLESTTTPLPLPELEIMHLKKTGALIRAAILMGAHCGPTPLEAADLQQLTHFANRVGLLFQIVDDILDATMDTSTLGKTAGKDEAHQKATYVTLLGLGPARQRAKELEQEALFTLARLPLATRRLEDLTRFMNARHH